MRIVYLSLICLCSLTSCCNKPDINELLYRRVLTETKKLIDNDLIPHHYVSVFKWYTDSPSNAIYYVNGNPEGPLESRSWAPPSEVIIYRDKIISRFDFSKDILSKKELIALTNFENHPETVIDEGPVWIIGTSIHIDTCVVVTVNPDFKQRQITQFPQLLTFILSLDEIRMKPHLFFEQYTCIIDTLTSCLCGISRTVFSYNDAGMESMFSGLKRNNPFLATVNGQDTIHYILEDTLYRNIFVNPVFSDGFFNHLSEEKPFDHLYQLIKDSTFLFKRKGGDIERIHVPYTNIMHSIHRMDNKGYFLRDIFKKGTKDYADTCWGWWWNDEVN